MLDFFPAEKADRLQEAVRNSQAHTDPGAFRGFGSALADVLPSAALTSASAWGGMLESLGESMGRYSPGAVDVGLPVSDPSRAALADLPESGIPQRLREKAKDYAPDPLSVGTAGQIAHGVLTTLTKAGAYAISGPAAPALLGADLGVGRAQELEDKGVDERTAALSGVITGVANAVGMKLPAAMGATRTASVALGATVNPALNVAETGAIHLLLQHADYEKIAQQYQPFDPVNLAVAAITGGAFGAAFHRAGPGKALTPDEHAAALTMNEVRTRDADTLTQPGDLAASNAAREAQALARQQLDGGEQVSVAQQVAAEQTQLDAAYQRVLDSPAGPAFDPLVHITPDDIEGVIVSRGGTKGVNELEVKGGGFGLVKFIWKHGEESKKSPELQITRSDLLAFPEIIREFEPSRQADGTARGREWRVQLPDEQGNLRTVVFADNVLTGRDGRHLVTMHVQDPKHIAAELPLSQKRMAVEQNPSAELWRPTEDTARAVSLPETRGSAQPHEINVSQPGILGQMREAVSRLLGVEEAAPVAQPPKPSTPEQARALEIMARDPQAMVRLEDGTDVSMADLMRHADEAEATAKTESAGFEAAVNCALRHPE